MEKELKDYITRNCYLENKVAALRKKVRLQKKQLSTEYKLRSKLDAEVAELLGALEIIMLLIEHETGLPQSAANGNVSSFGTDEGIVRTQEILDRVRALLPKQGRSLERDLRSAEKGWYRRCFDSHTGTEGTPNTVSKEVV